MKKFLLILVFVSVCLFCSISVLSYADKCDPDGKVRISEKCADGYIPFESYDVEH
jgi:hypothetical protein